ncbi:MAG: efflux RND transporter periplasmic adaptor subunit [Planctomycetota bacterium]
MIRLPISLRRGWLIALACCLSIGCDERKTATTKTPPPTPVLVVKALARDIPIYRSYPGTTQALSTVQVSARVEGYLEASLFTEGEHVEAGQPLYEIQPDQYEADLIQAQADVAIAQSNLAFAKQEYDRNEPLSQTGAISQQSWDRYAHSYADAQGQLAAAEANLLDAELNLSYTRVVAPIDGRIGADIVDVGNLVGPGTSSGEALAQIVQLHPIRVVFQPGADEYAAFANASSGASGIPVRIAIAQRSGSPLTFDGAIDLLNNTAQPGTSTFIARAQFPNPRGLVLPGQYTTVRVRLGTVQNAVLVPTDALYKDPRDHYVLMLKDGDTLQRQTVAIGDEVGGYTHIVSGLSAGETVAVAASPVVLRGSGKVKPREVDPDQLVAGKVDEAKPGGATNQPSGDGGS